jgi:nucleotide-binding universal stress UspA family protein
MIGEMFMANENEVSYGTIVVTTDGSPSSLEGGRHAIVLAKMSSARLRVINVIDASVAIQPYANPGIAMQPYANPGIGIQLYADPGVILKGYQDEGELLIAEIVQLGKNAGIQDVSGEVVIGSPRQTIVDWSKEQGADMIVVGSHGSSRLTYLLIGSVAEHLVRHAHCPVLVVRKCNI